MLRKSLLLLLVTSLIAGIGFMIFLTVEKLSDKKLAQLNRDSLSSFILFDLDSVRFDVNSDRKIVLVYFESDCSHCEYELEQINNNKSLFGDAEIILTSSEQIPSIKAYAGKNGSLQDGNIRFAKINADEAYRKFGSLVVPQIFIYGTDGRLVRTFQGETKIEAIIQYL